MNDTGRIFHDGTHWLALAVLGFFVIRGAQNHIDPDSTTGKTLAYLFH